MFCASARQANVGSDRYSRHEIFAATHGRNASHLSRPRPCLTAFRVLRFISVPNEELPSASLIYKPTLPSYFLASAATVAKASLLPHFRRSRPQPRRPPQGHRRELKRPVRHEHHQHTDCAVLLYDLHSVDLSTDPVLHLSTTPVIIWVCSAVSTGTGQESSQGSLWSLISVFALEAPSGRHRASSSLFPPLALRSSSPSTVSRLDVMHPSR